MNLLKPIRSPIAQSRIAVPNAPDCDMKAMSPFSGMPAAKEALSFSGVLIRPRQFGPMMRMPFSRATSTTLRSSSAPSRPVSLKPAVMTISAGTFFAAQSRVASRQNFAGITSTARSTSPGMSRTDRKQGRPRIWSALGLTG